MIRLMELCNLRIRLSLPVVQHARQMMAMATATEASCLFPALCSMSKLVCRCGGEPAADLRLCLARL